MRCLMFFDLENTLIHHWTDQRLCWQDNNRKFLGECQPDVIGIFSYALWCDENIDQFINGHMLPMIQDEYGIEVDQSLIIHVDEIMAAMNRSPFRAGRPEVNRNNEKEYGFYDWCYANYASHLQGYDEVWLVDDTIDDGEDTDFFSDIKLVFRNPVVIQSFV